MAMYIDDWSVQLAGLGTSKIQLEQLAEGFIRIKAPLVLRNVHEIT
ncbi:MAG: hypothetical protein V3U88_09325 [Methylococcales bacterium]